MNYRYVPDQNFALKQILSQRPTASLHELRAAHPVLRSMSVDHLAMRLGQLDRDPGAGSLK